MRRAPDRDGCAAESRLRGEGLAGTASRVQRWLLVEQPGPWGRDAPHDSRMDDAVAEAIAGAATAAGARVLLIRDFEHEPVGGRTAFLVRSDVEHRWVERVRFDDPRELLDVDLGVLAADERPGLGEAVDATVRLVCTNGRHDPCCADFGRPVVRALREAGVETWESSHVGGDRFAANVVCLPTGVYFGRVPPEEAATILAEHDLGLLDLDHYRGRSCFAPLVQAAEIYVRRALDERSIEGLPLEGWQLEGDTATVAFRHERGPVTATVTRHRSDAQLLTCGDASSPPWAYRLDALARP